MMKHESLFIHAAWYDRREDAQSCAERMSRMLDELSTGHPSTANWYYDYPAIPFGDTKNDRSKLVELFEEGLARRDDNGKRIPGSGHHLFISNNATEDDRRIQMYVYAGYWKEQRYSGRNKFVAFLPAYKSGNEDMLSLQVLLPLLTAIIHAWDPEFAILGGDEMLQFAELWEGRERPQWPFGNWVIYLSAPLAALVTPPREALVKELPGFGKLLVATEAPFTAANPEHVRICEAIHHALAPVRAFLGEDN